MATPRASARGVAVFDLDGTITWHDTLVRYLAGALAVHPARMLRLWPLPLVLAAFALDRDRGALKSRVIRAALGGLARADVERLTRRFVTERLPALLRPAALEAVARHRAAGDYLVLLSASTDFYVRAIGAELGFDEVICTEVRWQGDRLDGHLATANRRGSEKTRCLEALRARHPGAAIVAYGNAGSDLEHLARADRGVLVNGSRRTRRRAAALGIPEASWG